MPVLLPPRADLVVIGGGLLGLTSAYECARRGLDVVLIERDRTGHAQSSRNLGFVRRQGRASTELPLMEVARRRWQSLNSELGVDVEYQTGGNLRLTDDRAKAARYEQWAQMARERGIDTRLLSGTEVRAILPGASRFELALFTADDGQANPEATCRAYSCAARKAGVTIIEGCAAIDVTTAGGAVSGLQTTFGQIASPLVLLAAGTGSRKLAHKLGLTLPQQITRMTVVLTSATEPITPVSAWTGRLFLRQDRRGRFRIAAEGQSEIVLGPGSFRDARRFLPSLLANRADLHLRADSRRLIRALTRAGAESGGDSTSPAADPADVAYCLSTLPEYFPALRETLTVERSWAGEIDATPDALPVIGSPQAMPGLLVATGMSGHGFGLAPAIGTIVADLALGADSEIDLHPFRLERFTDGSILKPTHLL